jgi:hypothetical protein
VATEFNNKIRSLLNDKELWQRLSLQANSLESLSKQEIVKDLQRDLEIELGKTGRNSILRLSIDEFMPSSTLNNMKTTKNSKANGVSSF